MFLFVNRTQDSLCLALSVINTVLIRRLDYLRAITSLKGKQCDSIKVLGTGEKRTHGDVRRAGNQEVSIFSNIAETPGHTHIASFLKDISSVGTVLGASLLYNIEESSDLEGSASVLHDLPSSVPDILSDFIFKGPYFLASVLVGRQGHFQK